MEYADSHVLAAPLDAVWAMFGDPESHVTKFESMGHRDIEVLEAEADDSTIRIVVRRVVDLEVPGFARRVLQPSNTVTSTDEWRRHDDVATGTQRVDTAGAPVKISGSTRLEAAGDRTHYEVIVDVDVKVPLIGKRLSGWARGTVRAQMDAEFAAADRWLAVEQGGR